MDKKPTFAYPQHATVSVLLSDLTSNHYSGNISGFSVAREFNGPTHVTVDFNDASIQYLTRAETEVVSGSPGIEGAKIAEMDYEINRLNKKLKYVQHVLRVLCESKKDSALELLIEIIG